MTTIALIKHPGKPNTYRLMCSCCTAKPQQVGELVDGKLVLLTKKHGVRHSLVLDRIPESPILDGK